MRTYSASLPMRPRLLFVSNLFPDTREPYRGLDNVTLLHHLKERWDIRVISPRPLLKAWRGASAGLLPRSQDEVFQPRYVAVPYVPRIGDLWNPRLMHRALVQALSEVEREGEWELLLSSWLYPDGWAATKVASQMGTPAVMIAQGSDVHKYLRVPRRRQAILEAVAMSRAVITRSRSLATLLGEAGAATGKLHPVHNGVDVSVFHGGPLDEERQKLGLPEDRTVIFYVGNLLPVKNPGLLLRAFAKLKASWQGPPLQLTLAGRGPMRGELESLARELGLHEEVHFLGPQDAGQIASWMRASDVLCMSSHNEGLPNVVLEAMASGLPVVATDVGGIHEIVDAPWKGLLVPPGNEEGLAQGLQRVLEGRLDRQKIAAYGAGLSWTATADACDRILRAAQAG
jgi:teichuronic acid biosynthesis glycosyltransferase TuaC